MPQTTLPKSAVSETIRETKGETKNISLCHKEEKTWIYFNF